MILTKSKITNLNDKKWFSFENREDLQINANGYVFKNGDLVIFNNSKIVWKIQK